MSKPTQKEPGTPLNGTEGCVSAQDCRGPLTSKIRLTYGIDVNDERDTDDIATSSINSSDTSSSRIIKSIVKYQDNVELNTKETHQYHQPISVNSDKSSSQLPLSINTKIRISTTNFTKIGNNSTKVGESSRKMDKSSTSTSTGTSSGSLNQSAPVAEKRPLSATASAPQEHVDENEDETKKKKQKTSVSANTSSGTSSGASSKEEGNNGKDSVPSSSSGSSASAGTIAGTGSILGKGGRSTRGSSSEKNTGKTYIFRY